MQNISYHTSTEKDLNVQLSAPCEDHIEKFPTSVKTVSATPTSLDEIRRPSLSDVQTTVAASEVVSNDTQKTMQEKIERKIETDLTHQNERTIVDNARIERISEMGIAGIGPSILPEESYVDVHEDGDKECQLLGTDNMSRYKVYQLEVAEQNTTQFSSVETRCT